MNVQRELLVQSYRLRVKAERDLTLAKRSLHSRSNHLLVYFKGEQGLTQTLMLPLSQIKDGVYENFFELLNVGNLSVAHLKLDADDARWKIDAVELERDNSQGEKILLNFPVNHWLDSARHPKIDVLINEGSAQLAPIYTITICTGAISRCSGARIHVALIGDGASTVPFDLSSNSTLTPCTTRELFQSGAQDSFYISPFDTVDVGQLFHLQLQCESRDELPYYCESIEVKNHFSDERYFVLVNHWFGQSLEHKIILPVLDRRQESNVYTISIKTTQISELSGQNTLDIHMTFANGKTHQQVLSSSETHQIAFQKDHVDFFLVSLDNMGDSQITHVKARLISTSIVAIQWDCAWMEIRDTFYQRSYWYVLRKTLVRAIDGKSSDYVDFESITDLSSAKNLNYTV